MTRKQLDEYVADICEQLLLVGALHPADAPVQITLLPNVREGDQWQR